MVVADLHVHTTNSDGTLSLSALPAAARRAGLEAVAVTDHDRPHPKLSEPVERRDGVTVVHGIELRVETPTLRVDLLGYGLDPTPALLDECDHLARDRLERAREMIDLIEARLDVSLDLDPFEGIGRPHVARAIDAHPETDYDVDGAFAELIGDGGPCYVSRDLPSFERGRTLLAEACAFVGLAHPLRYEDVDAALALTADLDAIEREYPYGESVDLTPIDRAVADHDLLVTGGSDAHDDCLGVAGLDRDAYERVRAYLN